jgi:hypothetical protein
MQVDGLGEQATPTQRLRRASTRESVQRIAESDLLAPKVALLPRILLEPVKKETHRAYAARS